MTSTTVYFATNRRPDPTAPGGYGAGIIGAGDRAAYAVVPVSGISLDDEGSGVLGTITEATTGQFAETVGAEIGASGRNLLVFIHGFDNSFEDAIKRAAFNREWFAASGLPAGASARPRRSLRPGSRCSCRSCSAIPMTTKESCSFRNSASREFDLFANGGGSPVVTWLRALGRHARQECGGPGVGAVGMCLTGNFAIALMTDDVVLAPVASQPALPLTAALPVLGDIARGSHEALAMTAEDLAAAKQRAGEGVKIMCLRFSNDSVSPVERFDAMQKAFGASFVPFLLGSEKGIDSSPGNPYGLPPRAHSVLTGEYQADEPNHPSRMARNAVIAFLLERLGPVP